MKNALPIFDKTVTSLEEFDPILANHLKTIKGQDCRRSLVTDIDGTASLETDDPADLQLVKQFLDGCGAWHDKGAEVNWISPRGVKEGPGNLLSLRLTHDYIRIMGCDGSEAFIKGSVIVFSSENDFSRYLAPLDALRKLYPLDPITVSPVGYSVLGVFIKSEHPAYELFRSKMNEIAKSLKQEKGNEYVVKCHSSRIVIEQAGKSGKREAIFRIRHREAKQIGLEIYGGNGKSDIGAQRLVNAQPHGFAYKVFSSRLQLQLEAAAPSNDVSGLVDGPEEWGRFLAMVAAEL